MGNNIFSNHTNINVHLPPRPYIFYIDILYSTHHITINIQCTDKFQFVQFQVIFQTKLELNILENIGRVIFQVKAVLARLMSKCLKMSYNLIPQDQYFHPSYCKIERSFSSVLCLSAQFNSFSVIVSTQKTNYGEAWPGAASAVDASKRLSFGLFLSPAQPIHCPQNEQCTFQTRGPHFLHRYSDEYTIFLQELLAPSNLT